MKKITIGLLAALAAVTVAQLAMTQGRTRQKSDMEPVARQENAAIGGSFTLTDQNGASRRDGDFRGRVMLVSFGFTHCPDICPITVGTLSKTMETLAAKGDNVAPLFITVDPQRDTPSVLKEYLTHFDGRIIGLTGSEVQIRQVADAYKIYYARSQEKQGKGDYSIDHSGYIYLMGKDGQFIRVFPYNASETEVAAAIESALQ
jgi:cytochrome oxidase Cu insertion factor (SCO1/SenC/PrrC family)